MDFPILIFATSDAMIYGVVCAQDGDCKLAK